MLSHGRENMKQDSVFANVDKWVELPEKRTTLKNFSWNKIVKS